MLNFIHTWGSTPAERARVYPCDQHVTGASGACFRAVDVAAPVALTFRWLCQLRAAPYSYDWLDNFGHRSPRERTPDNERLARGDTMMRVFKLVEFERDRHLTMVVTGTKLFGEVALTYQVSPGQAGSRLLVKFLYRLPAWSPMRFILPSGDLVMMRKQLLTLKRLAEREHAGSGAITGWR
jgi:hypothetical protein